MEIKQGSELVIYKEEGMKFFTYNAILVLQFVVVNMVRIEWIPGLGILSSSAGKD